MTESFEDILRRMREVYEEKSGHCPEDVSDTGLRLRVMAGELCRLWAEVDWLRRQAFPQTAAGEWLDRHGEARGVARRRSEKAGGTLRFSRYIPLSFDVVIPAGTVCSTPGSDPVEFETTEDGVLSAGEVNLDVPARALLGGEEGNVSAGLINTMTSPPTGVNYVTNPAGFTGGRGAEEDEIYRARVIAAYRQPSNGANPAFYKDAAMACEGIASAGVVSRVNGAGTVGVYLWGEHGAPGMAKCAAVAEALNAVREIGVTVTAEPASARTVNVTCRMQLEDGADFEQAEKAVKQAVNAFFAGLSVGSPVYMAQLEQAVLNAAPIVRLEFPATMHDVECAQSEMPVVGAVTVEEIE